MQPFSVVASSIANQKPMTLRGSVQRVVGMARHLTADVRLLEDVHRLQQERIDHAEIRCHVGKCRSSAECIELGIEVVHRMTELVQ